MVFKVTVFNDLDKFEISGVFGILPFNSVFWMVSLKPSGDSEW